MLANGPLTTLASDVALARSAGLCPAFRRSGGLPSHFEVRAGELEVELLPVGSLPECADRLPEPLLCALHHAAQITSSCRNERTAVRVLGGGGATGCSQEDEQGPPVPCGQSGETWTGHLAGWAAFGTNGNLLTKMVALGFHEADKSNRFQTNSV